MGGLIRPGYEACEPLVEAWEYGTVVVGAPFALSVAVTFAVVDPIA
jgi:hypothetical protein